MSMDKSISLCYYKDNLRKNFSITKNFYSCTVKIIEVHSVSIDV